MQVESPLRSNDFFIKKVCIAAKLKKKLLLVILILIEIILGSPKLLKQFF